MSLQRSPEPLAGFKGPTSKGRYGMRNGRKRGEGRRKWWKMERSEETGVGLGK